MTRTMLVAIAFGGALLIVAGTANAAVDRAALCKDKKAKATGKKAFDFLKAFGKNLKTPNSGKLDSDISKAKSKFTKSFSKAESKRACQTTDDTAAIESKVDDLVFELVASIDPNCGDNVRAGTDEECDGSDKDACSGQCIPAGGGGGGGFCGDNVLTVNGGNECTCAPEDCDGPDDAACAGLCQPNCRCPVPVCGNGVVEAGEVCEPPCAQGPPCGAGEICSVTCQCVPEVPCSCGGTGSPTTLRQTVEIDPAAEGEICGEMRDAEGAIVRDLYCAQSYIGGGNIGTPLGTPVAIGSTVYNVECCNGTSLALTNSTEAETGSIGTCSSIGCRTGAPVPLFNVQLPTLSVCIIEEYVTDALGVADCSTGEASLNMTVAPHSYMYAATASDSMTRRCDSNSGVNEGRRCRPKCSGGTNEGEACTEDSNCSGGCSEDGGIVCLDDTECSGTCTNPPPGVCDEDYVCSPGTCLWDWPSHCDSDSGENAGVFCTTDSDCAPGTCLDFDYMQPCPICNPNTLKCNGGFNDGGDCTPGNSADLGPRYPTSNDCATPTPGSSLVIATLYPWALRTETAIKQAADGHFCRFCRDVDDESSQCFDGDPDLGPPLGARSCPDSAVIPDCQPASYHAGVPGASIDGCGTAIPCNSNADCYAPYEKCEQFDSGGFNRANARYIEERGVPAGDLSDRAPHDMTLASVFCGPPTFNNLVDLNVHLPAPGASVLPGTLQLQP